MKSNSPILYPFPSFLKTTVRISWIMVISFMLRVLKKAVNLDSSLSNAWLLNKRASNSKKVLRGVFKACAIFSRVFSEGMDTPLSMREMVSVLTFTFSASWACVSLLVRRISVILAPICFSILDIIESLLNKNRQFSSHLTGSNIEV